MQNKVYRPILIRSGEKNVSVLDKDTGRTVRSEAVSDHKTGINSSPHEVDTNLQMDITEQTDVKQDIIEIINTPHQVQPPTGKALHSVTVKREMLG